MDKKFYITTPLYYVNASPHIGHSYTTIAADTLSRRMRQILGKDHVWFLTGTDEHGLKIQRAADAAHISPQVFADGVAATFKSLWAELGISYDDFIRTTEERHKRIVARVLDIVYAKGDIYQSTYDGWYCSPCESFWTDAQAVDSACPDCKRPVERIAEKNYFFKLSKYQDWLISHIESHPDFVKPEIRRNEVLSFLRMNKLTDLCISRPKDRLSWGIPLPFSPDHVTYVWFDALINYISAVGDFDANGVYRSPWWPAQVQLIGKDILRQHAIYWPIMLKALDIEPPHSIVAHGWWMVGDTKMSKSRGNVVAPLDMAKTYGNDAYRYFLLRDVPFGMDGSFSEESIIKRLNGDLANDLGNLVYRTLTMVEKYYQGKVPAVDIKAYDFDAAGKAIVSRISSVEQEMAQEIDAGSEFNFAGALERLWELVNMANKYVEETKPWNLAKEGKAQQLEAFIKLLVEVIRRTGFLLEPFMPQTGRSIQEQVGKETICKGAPLFPRIETEESKRKEKK
jgi:methionyl-tRNA synthetase